MLQSLKKVFTESWIREDAFTDFSPALMAYTITLTFVVMCTTYYFVLEVSEYVTT